MAKQREIRASFTEETIRVYQAYNRQIAQDAVAFQRFSDCANYKLQRMTWIKPSFCWMAYRAGYSYKDANQECILAIDLKRDWFDTVVKQAAITNDHGPGLRSSEVVVQWDPERDIEINRLDY
eukprot:9326981-Pyramimonas_sp.AAC.1